MDTNMRTELCVEAFERACKNDGAGGMILHSDRGSQFTSYAFREALKKHRAKQSMSGVGRCYDNARMESFFATLKKEKLYQMDTTKMTVAEVKRLFSATSTTITLDESTAQTTAGRRQFIGRCIMNH